MKGLRRADLWELPQYDSGDAGAPAENLDVFAMACQRPSARGILQWPPQAGCEPAHKLWRKRAARPVAGLPFKAVRQRARPGPKLRLFAHFGPRQGCRSGVAALPRASVEPRP